MLNREICVQQEVQTFEKMHLKLKQPISQYLFYLTGTTQNSEDVSQEVFIKLWINWGKLQGMNEHELKDYVFVVLRNHIINERRQKNRPKNNKRRLAVEYVETHAGHYWHDEILIAEGFKQHQQAVERLAKRERLVYLYHINDYSAGEIAKLINRSKYTVHNQLSAAYKNVKTYLNKSCGWNLRKKGEKIAGSSNRLL